MTPILRPATSLGLALLLLSGSSAFCEESPPGNQLPHPATASVSAMGTILSRADVAVARQSIVTNEFKAGFGEAHMQRYLTHHLRATGNWQPTTARLGRQGIDGLYLKIDSRGRIRDLIVSEAKFGTSTLGITKDGVQMGKRWISSRLTTLGRTYGEIANSIDAGKVAVEKLPVGRAAQRVQIPLNDGKAAVFWREIKTGGGTPPRVQIPFNPAKAAVFWREKTTGEWKLAGTERRLKESASQCRKIGDFLDAAAQDRISYRSYIYRVQLKDNALHVRVKDAANLDALGSESKLPVARELTVPLDANEMRSIQQMSQREVASLLRSKFPTMSKSDIESYSSDITRAGKRLEQLFAGMPTPVWRSVASTSLKSGAIAAVIAAPLSALEDYYRGGKIDWDRFGRTAGVSFASAGVATAAGQTTVVYVVRNPVLQQFASRTASMLNVSSGTLVNSAGGLVSGSVGSILFAYGGYFAGLHDLTAANRMAVSGVAGTAIGSAAYVGTLSVVATYGTASTGVAISTLSGAAATNASLAVLGGGTVAAGGGGVALGTVILTGGAAIVAVAGAGVVMYGFELHDRRQDIKRIDLTIDYLKSKKDFNYNARLRETYGSRAP